MGRYYSGDINGKFWVAIQNSDAAERFGLTGYIPNYITYDIDSGNIVYDNFMSMESNIFSVYEFVKLSKRFNKLIDDSLNNQDLIRNSIKNNIKQYIENKNIPDIIIEANLDKWFSIIKDLKLPKIDEEKDDLKQVDNLMKDGKYDNINEMYNIIYIDIELDEYHLNNYSNPFVLDMDELKKSNYNKDYICNSDNKELLSELADLELGFKIYNCLLNEGICRFEAEC